MSLQVSNRQKLSHYGQHTRKTYNKNTKLIATKRDLVPYGNKTFHKIRGFEFCLKEENACDVGVQQYY